MRRLLLVTILVLGGAAAAPAEQDYFLSRDQVLPAETYLDSDGGVTGDEPADSPWETFVGERPRDRYQLPGPFPLLETAPELQTLVVGPSFRNQKNRIEVGAGFGYVNSRWAIPFEFSVEPTYRRNKHVNGTQEFSRVRTFALAEVWSRGTEWESTSFAAYGFYDTQSNSFDQIEFGGSATQVIGRRLSISADIEWAGEWASGASFNNAAIGSLGASYNLGAGLRFGGFYEFDNSLFKEDDWGGFVSYQLLPFCELVVNAGKHEFVLVRLLFSYALERP